jgi:hypothetical protein
MINNNNNNNNINHINKNNNSNNKDQRNHSAQVDLEKTLTQFFSSIQSKKL